MNNILNLSTLNEWLDKIIEKILRLIIYINENWWGGIFWILIGIYGASSLYKDRKNYKDSLYILGWAGSFGMILLGFLILYRHLT